MQKSLKNKIRIFLFVFILFVLFILVSYFALAFYYRDGFSFGTWINGIYCTGKNVDEVNDDLLSKMNYPDLVMIDRLGHKSILRRSEFSFSVDYKEQLRSFQEEQNPFLWVDQFLFRKEYHILPKIEYDKKALLDIVEELPIIQAEEHRLKDVKILHSHKGYTLYNGMEQVLNMDKMMECIEFALQNEERELNLLDLGCYEALPLTKKMEEKIALWDQLKVFQECHVIYDFHGKKVPISIGESSLFVQKDEAGNFVKDELGNFMVDEEAVRDFIAKLANEYDTYGMTREFQTTCGKKVTIHGGTYGNAINQKKETEYLIDAFLNRTNEVHVPSYRKEMKNQSGYDIGNTYIEIDLTDQKLYYYEEGVKKIEADVVTGNIKRHHDTPEGVNYVYTKQRNRTLRGANYEAFVRFWMPVVDDIGIHDASWRRKFGGDIYLTQGSHGCINTPFEEMKELFDSVEVGTPVVMFYHD